MSSSLPTLLRAFKALVMCLTVLCLLAQPVLAAAHTMHDAVHAHSDAQPTGPAGSEPESEPGSLDRLVHVFDCCLHATALPTPMLVWSAQRLSSPPPQAPAHQHAPSPTSKLLRPPIAA